MKQYSNIHKKVPQRVKEKDLKLALSESQDGIDAYNKAFEAGAYRARG